jgi:hypothetical protein
MKFFKYLVEDYQLHYDPKDNGTPFCGKKLGRGLDFARDKSGVTCKGCLKKMEKENKRMEK